MNSIKIYILLFVLSNSVPSILYSLSSSNNPTLTVNATITTHDGTTTELNDIRINNGTEIWAYEKPTTKNNTESSEIRLTSDPIKFKVGPIQLATTRTIKLQKPKTLYIYQEKETNNNKQYFVEADIDGTSYLIRNNWTLTGKDANRLARTIEFSIINTITMTGACAKIVSPTESTAACVCPVPK